jgi:hypothetical protein
MLQGRGMRSKTFIFRKNKCFRSERRKTLFGYAGKPDSSRKISYGQS